jgi:hypothetical protein
MQTNQPEQFSLFIAIVCGLISIAVISGFTSLVFKKLGFKISNPLLIFSSSITFVFFINLGIYFFYIAGVITDQELLNIVNEIIPIAAPVSIGSWLALFHEVQTQKN